MKPQLNKMLILLLLIFVSDSYSATPPKYGGVLRFAISQRQIALDPLKILTPIEYYVANGIFNGLVKYEAKKLLPAIASSWDISDDQVSYTFHISDSIKFHNGRGITANDVKYSFQRSIRNADTESLSQSSLNLISGADAYRQGKANSVKGLQVLDENTIQISLTQPDESFLSGLDTPLAWILPKESAENPEFDHNPIGSGSFRVGSASDIEGEILSLEANEDYFLGRPYIDRISIVSASDFSSLLINFETDALDCLEIPNIEFGRFRNDPAWSSQLISIVNSQLMCIQINKKSFSAKSKINSLLRYGIDTSSILDMLYDQGTPLSDSDYQLERARKESTEFQNKRIKFIVLDSEDAKKTADRISFDMAKAGVILDIVSLSCHNFNKALDDGSYSLALISFPSIVYNIYKLNKSIYVPLFYQNTNFLQKNDIQMLSKLNADNIIQFDSLYFLKSQKKK